MLELLKKMLFGSPTQRRIKKNADADASALNGSWLSGGSEPEFDSSPAEHHETTVPECESSFDSASPPDAGVCDSGFDSGFDGGGGDSGGGGSSGDF